MEFANTWAVTRVHVCCMCVGMGIYSKLRTKTHHEVKTQKLNMSQVALISSGSQQLLISRQEPIHYVKVERAN